MKMGMIHFNDESFPCNMEVCESCPILRVCSSSFALNARLEAESRKIQTLMAAVEIQKNELDVLRKNFVQKSYLK
jgi:hypothetical protein